ncbi:hypothetical protein, variant 1 [Aphanomyces astaci]|uniref:WW domain-containing protein n=1 Tax=Aphanomyces astaci TaxID=112090 RepID=W4FC80_APHAT|nr:hypothetical protein, variant 1 [Aphanomyces astaci]ETV65050.1 hypothetical protein, variant 1 [Aphanomyces astaci]|eukprot:XP_009845448.1 hypothetical protein, variant 1 [Aphanomyces astaci]
MSISLRDGWEEAVDPSTNRAFYFNRASNETSWVRPAANEDALWKARARVVLTKEAAVVLIQKMWRARTSRQYMQSLMQSLYKRIYDPSTQEYFYYNAQTGQSSWMTPRGLKTKPQTSPNVGDESDMLPPGWQATFDNVTQRVYYVNESTGESSWTMPLMPSHMSDELDEFSHTFQDHASAILIQAAWRGVLARNHFRGMLEAVDGSPIFIHKETQKRTRALLPFDPLHRRRVDSSGGISSERSLNLSKRRLPRSKAQIIVDAAEDSELDDIPVLEVNLSRLNAVVISGRVWNLEHLETLNLSGNQLGRIPSAIQDLTALVHLDVSHNHLTSLPVGLQTTATLRHLDASHNYIRSFSPKLWKLRGLTSLDLSYNVMTDLPFIEGDLRLLKETSAWQVSIGLLTALTALNLSHNQLTKCPALIDNCTALATVDLSYNSMPALESEFGNLRALEVCLLQHNALSELPDSLGRLSSLRTLDISYNQLQCLPPSIGSCAALIRLDGSYNQLTEIPSGIKSLTSLISFDLSHNPSLEFPNVLPFLERLETVALDHCGLPDVPTNAFAYSADMPLHTVRLSSNGITQVPLDVELLRNSLKLLHLGRNAISSIPTRLYECTQLVELHLSHNLVVTLPPGLANLNHVSYNQLTVVPDDLVRLYHLRILNLAYNKLHQLPGRLGFLQRLEHLDLSHNALRWLPTTCHHLVRVKFVSAAFNQLERRPPFFYDGSVYVDWSNNPFKASEVTSRPLLDLVAKAKHDLAQRNYTTAAALFSNLLEQIASFPGVPKEVEPIRAQATFYRGICRYQQICQALAAIESLSDESSLLEKTIHEQRLVEPWGVKILSNDQVFVAQTRLNELVQQKITWRTAVTEWQVEATDDLNQSIRFKVEATTAAFTLGSLFVKTFQLPEAIEMLTNALTYFTNGLTPGAVPILLQRGDAWEQLGQPQLAKDDYKVVLGVIPFHEAATERLAALETHQAKYHVGFDTDSYKRAFAIEPSGICRRRNDPMISLALLNEIDSPAEFGEACDSLRDARQRAVYLEMMKKKEAKVARQERVAQVKQRMREIQECRAMEKEEEDQLEREAEIEFARRQKALELQREENERQWMQYEEAAQRWVESERERIRLEELEALEEARRKEEAKAEYKKRLARRGGLRQGGRTRGGKR